MWVYASKKYDEMKIYLPSTTYLDLLDCVILTDSKDFVCDLRSSTSRPVVG